MLIIAVDESIKKSLVRARRILGKYLFQHGQATYAGHISQEGLQALVHELKAAASKTTAVGLFTAGNSRGLELVATIGRAGEFSPEGYHAHRVRRNPAEANDGPQLTSTQRLLRLLTQMAALFHDLGKASLQFQRKLRGDSSGPERVRHDLLSYLMLEHWQDTLDAPSCWLAALESTAQPLLTALGEGQRVCIRPELASVLARMSDPGGHSELTELANRILKNPTAGDPLWGGLLWLVLTHHHLVAADNLRHEVPTLKGAQLNDCPFDPDNLILVSKDLPWDDQAWCEQVQACARQISRVKADNPGIVEKLTEDAAGWTTTLANVCRPYLVFSDYTGSLLKAPTEKPSKKELSRAFANTIKVAGQDLLADTLPTHLKKVRRAVDPVFALCEASGDFSLPCIETAHIPTSSLIRQTPGLASAFYWQHEGAAELIKQVPDIARRPGFLVLASGTGSGKTAGGVRMLEAACGGRLRFTAALGLRSLTLQTGAAYTAKTGIALPANEVMTVVGDALYAKLNAVGEPTAGPFDGSESLIENEFLTIGGSEDYQQGQSLAVALGLDASQVESLLANRKSVAMTQVPVLVCTVDHLMKAAAPQRGGDTRMMLRLATADLLLDEVDNYSAEDLVCLGRLVHAAGVHGRRVVLMSATVSETVVKALHASWLAGLRAYDLRKERPSDHYMALICDKAPPKVAIRPSLEQANETVDSFTTALIAGTPPESQRNIGGVLSMGTSIDEAFPRLYAASLGLANDFSTSDCQGRTLSTGVVRFNQVRGAREFAQYLHAAEIPQGVSVKVVCYHRRMPLYHLTLVERTLNALLNRKDPPAIFAEALISDWMAAEPSIQKFVLIVCATSIQETGRDHDYDFAIAEPWSTRSFVQLAGRVRRHRPGRATGANVLLMDRALSQLRPRGKNHVELANSSTKGPLSAMSSILNGTAPLLEHLVAVTPLGFGQVPSVPALMSTLKALGTLEGSTPAPKVLVGAGSMDTAAWSAGITAHHCLRAPPLSQAALTGLEHAMQHARMHDVRTWSLARIVSGNTSALFAGHHRAVRFRRQTAQQVQLTFIADSNCSRLALVRRGDYGVELEPALFEETSLLNPERALIRIDLAVHTRDLAVPDDALRNANSLSAKLLYSFESYGNDAMVYAGQPIISFHPLLGADSVRTRDRT